MDFSYSYESYKAAIESFKLAYTPENAETYSETKIEELNTKALKAGYLIERRAFAGYMAEFVDDIQINPNSTFYKTWEDVTNRTREQLLYDQLLHYFTVAAGLMNKNCPNGFVINNEPVEIDFTKYTYIQAASATQIAEKCLEMLESGIALSTQTLNMCFEFIELAYEREKFRFTVDNIKNREALITLCKKFNIRPTDPVDLLRYIIYDATQSTLLIKSDDMISIIKGTNYSLDYLTYDEMVALSSVFYRFKPLFLAFKKLSKYNAQIVNKIRRLAKKYHKPFIAGFFEDMFKSDWRTPDNVRKIYKIISNETNPFKLIRAFGALNTYLTLHTSNLQGDIAITYIIRNHKQFTRSYSDIKKLSENDIDALKTFKAGIFNRLVYILNNYTNQTQKYKVLLPKDYELVCPISEKMYLGNMPFGTYFPLQKNNFFGVYWRNEWGTYDFDLSFTDFNGNRYGWNSDFYDNDKTVVFSGDMTNAAPCATEMFYCKDKMPDGIIRLNRYRGEENSKARMFFGSQIIPKLTKNYMVDPDCIKFRIDIISGEKSQQCVGIVIAGRYYAFELPEINTRISGVSKIQEQIMHGLKLKLHTGYIKLKEILEASNFWVETDIEKFVDEEGNRVEPDFDFTNLEKDTLIKFFKDAAEAL